MSITLCFHMPNLLVPSHFTTNLAFVTLDLVVVEDIDDSTVVFGGAKEFKAESPNVFSNKGVAFMNLQ